MSRWWTNWSAEQKLRRNEDRAIAQFEDQIRKITEGAAPTIQRAMALKDGRTEDLLLSQRHEKTRSSSAMHPEPPACADTAHRPRFRRACGPGRDRKQFQPWFHLLTKDGKSRVECAIAESRRGRWINRITVLGYAATLIGAIVAIIVAVHTWSISLPYLQMGSVPHLRSTGTSTTPG
jgi:hypothetical protein